MECINNIQLLSRSKAEVRDANIGSLGGSPQYPAIGGTGEQASLAWIGEETPERSEVPALCGPEQRPALPWHEEEREVLNPVVNSASHEPLPLPDTEPHESLPMNEESQQRVTQVPTNEPVLDAVKPMKRRSRKDRPSVQFSSQHEEDEKSFVGEDIDVTIPKVVDFHSTVSSASREPILLPTAKLQASLPMSEEVQERVIQLPPKPKPKRRKSRKDRPSVQFLHQIEEEERSSVGEDVTILKVVGSSTPPQSPPPTQDVQQEIPLQEILEHQQKRGLSSGARPKTTGSRKPTTQPNPTLRSTSSRHQRNNGLLKENTKDDTKSEGAAVEERYSSGQDETSEDEFDGVSFEETDSDSEISNLIRDFIEFQKSESDKKSKRNTDRKKFRDRKITDAYQTLDTSRSRRRNESRFSSANYIRSKSTDAIFLSRLNETSETADSKDSLPSTDFTEESDSESALSSIIKGLMAYRKYKSDTKTSRKIGRREFEDRFTTGNPAESQERRVSLDPKRKMKGPTDQREWNDIELHPDKRNKRDKLLQTDNCDEDYETSVLQMTKMYNEERDIQTSTKFKSIRPLIDVFWTKILSKMIMKGYENHLGAPEKLWSNLANQISSDRGVETIIKLYKSKVKEVIKLGRKLVFENKYIHAMVAFYAASKLYQQSDRLDKSKEGIWTCFMEASNVTVNLSTNLQSHVIPLMREMIDLSKLYQSPSQIADELIIKSREYTPYFEVKHSSTAVLALLITAQLHKERNAGDESVHGILSSIEQISLIMEAKVSWGDTRALRFVIPFLLKMTDFLRLIQISNYNQFINEIQTEALKFESENKFISSVVLFYVAAKLHQLNNKGDESVMGIKQSVQQIRWLVGKMAQQDLMKRVVKDHVTPLMHEMIKFLQLIQDMGHKVRVEEEAWCLFDISLCHGYCNQLEEYAITIESAIELMKRDLGEEAQTYRIYGHCLHYAGYAHERMGNINEAIEMYNMSLEALMDAKDYPSGEVKNSDVEYVIHSLKSAGSKLHN
ncbi:uncharacterized protein LOC144427226 [Styela clava]